MLVDTPTADDEPVFFLWPEHVQAWNVFQVCRTQWHLGFAGREGLIYDEVRDEIRRRGLRRQKADRLFEQVRHIEWGAVDAWHEQRAAEARKRA